MNLFFKNKNDQKVNPVTEGTLSAIKSKTDLMSFDRPSSPASIDINIGATDSGTALYPVKPDGITRAQVITETTLSSVKDQIASLSFDATSSLLATNPAPSLDSVVDIKDTTTSSINPGSEEKVRLLRRMVKLMESRGTVDANNNRRIVVDSFGTGVISGTGITVDGVPMLTIASDSTLLTGVVTGLTTGMTSYVGWNNQVFRDTARNSFARGIRSKLIFT